MLTGALSRRPHPHVYLKVQGRTCKVVHPQGFVPRTGLPSYYFYPWFRNQVSREVLNNLVPDWVERERAQRLKHERLKQEMSKFEAETSELAADTPDDLPPTVEVISLEQLWAKKGENPQDNAPGHSDWLCLFLDQEDVQQNRCTVQDAYGLASPQQKQIMDRIQELIHQGHPDRGLIAEAGRRMGLPEGQAKLQVVRLRKKLGKKKRR